MEGKRIMDAIQIWMDFCFHHCSDTHRIVAVIKWFLKHYIASFAESSFFRFMEEQSALSDAATDPPEPHLKQVKPNVAAASRFKGVVSFHNGRWGTQIYANHQRIWLGTFKSEHEAAMAYDSAAIKLLKGDTHRNFPWTELTIHEPSFQTPLSTEAVLSMIKDGSYPSKFSDHMKALVKNGYSPGTAHASSANKVRQLFQKELTPSDVSKLNRLVIPKKYAVKYFPQFSDAEEHPSGAIDYVELVFYDRWMRAWKFRYCYWKSSQSFVFTRGWSRFASDRRLRAKDRVIFSAFECGDHGGSEARKLCMIDVEYNDDAAEERKMDESKRGRVVEDSCVDEMNYKEEEENVDCFAGSDHHVEKKVVKLFGVQIII